MKKVYLDPGHGGKDSGAVGVENIFEKDVVLAICLKIKTILQSRKIDVKMSRDADVFKSLDYRTTEANKWGADCLVSVHCNSFTNKDAKGLETYCFDLGKYSKLANCIQSELIKDKLYTINRGVKDGNLHMLRESKMAACLVELGFISNIEDIKLLLNKQDEYALAIADGICEFLGVKFTSNSPVQNLNVYNIITGGFGSKEKAQEKLDNLKGLTGWYLTLEEFKPNDWRIRTGGFTGEDRVKREMAALIELTGWWCTYEKEN